MIERAIATRFDLLALCEGLGFETLPARMAYVSIQIGHGRAWSFRAPGVPPVALMGIVHVADQSVIWFLSGSGADRHMLALVRDFRRILVAERRLVGRELVAHVARHNAAGQRLARLCGLERVPTETAIEVWRFA